MGSLVAIIGQPDGIAAQRQLQRMIARSPYHGEARMAQRDGIQVAVQARHGESQLLMAGDALLAIDGYIANWPDVCAHHGLAATPQPTGAQLALWSRSAQTVLAQACGEFAVLYLDLSTRQGFAATSVNGMRPLFYRQTGRELTIASEIAQLLAGSDATPQPAAQAIAEHLCFGGQVIDRGQTIYADVQRFLAPHVYGFALDDPRLTRPVRYWAPPDEMPASALSRDDAARALRETVQQATVQALPDQPSMLALSGGMDSTTLWAALQEQRRAGGDPGVRTVSMVFPGFDSDESAPIAAMLAHTGTTDGVLLDVSRDKPSAHFDELTLALDNPPTALSDFHIDLLCGAARANGRQVLLTGHGGDLFYAGSRYHLADLLRRGHPIAALRTALSMRNRRIQSLRVDALRRLWHYGLAIPGSWLERLRGGNRPPDWLAPRYRPLLDAVNAEWRSFTRSHGMARGDMLFVLATNQAGFAIELQIQRSGQLGVELRTPLMDNRLIELAFRIPQQHLQQGPYDKQLARLAWGDRLPAAVTAKPQLTAHNHPLQADLALLDKRPPNGGWHLAELGIISVDRLERSLADSRTRGEVPLALGRLLRTEALLGARFG